ncbi:DinB family protein [Actinotalea sp. K2]|uniref:DinB family protein n=1 Tax=Actinotalea sp. K2 TaxID=2939438 RepID=UPI0020170003|nr:DinB family protein [Actinotalea sp. K2]MCL3861174.1 DinB family protein [Actinotalea sp. K2]
MITALQLLHVCDRALDGMSGILEELGDDLANRAPDLPGANTPYAILTHCLGVIDAWAGHRVAGRALDRDREAEFRAAGPVAPLLVRVATVRRRLHQDALAADGAAPLRATTGHGLEDGIRTQGAALLHVLEELAQHHGQMELTRDWLRSSRSPLTPRDG